MFLSNHEIDAKTTGHPHLKKSQQELNQREQNLLRKIDEIFQYSDGDYIQKPSARLQQPSVEQITQPLLGM